MKKRALIIGLIIISVIIVAFFVYDWLVSEFAKEFGKGYFEETDSISK